MQRNAHFSFARIFIRNLIRSCRILNQQKVVMQVFWICWRFCLKFFKEIATKIFNETSRFKISKMQRRVSLWKWNVAFSIPTAIFFKHQKFQSKSSVDFESSNDGLSFGKKFFKKIFKTKIRVRFSFLQHQNFSPKIRPPGGGRTPGSPDPKNFQAILRKIFFIKNCKICNWKIMNCKKEPENLYKKISANFIQIS